MIITKTFPRSSSFGPLTFVHSSQMFSQISNGQRTDWLHNTGINKKIINFEYSHQWKESKINNQLLYRIHEVLKPILKLRQ